MKLKGKSIGGIRLGIFQKQTHCSEVMVFLTFLKNQTSVIRETKITGQGFWVSDEGQYKEKKMEHKW